MPSGKYRMNMDSVLGCTEWFRETEMIQADTLHVVCECTEMIGGLVRGFKKEIEGSSQDA